MIAFINPTAAEAIATKFPEISMTKGTAKYRMAIDPDVALDLIDWLCDKPFDGATEVIRLLVDANDEEANCILYTGEWTI